MGLRCCNCEGDGSNGFLTSLATSHHSNYQDMHDEACNTLLYSRHVGRTKDLWSIRLCSSNRQVSNWLLSSVSRIAYHGNMAVEPEDVSSISCLTVQVSPIYPRMSPCSPGTTWARHQQAENHVHSPRAAKLNGLDTPSPTNLAQTHPHSFVHSFVFPLHGYPEHQLRPQHS